MVDKLDFSYNKEYDLLGINEDKEYRKVLREEVILFSDIIDKFNKNLWKQSRNIVITNCGIYNFEKKELKRRIAVPLIKGVSTTTENDEFVIHCLELEHDYYYTSPRKRKIIQFLGQIYLNYNKENLPLCVLQLSSLASVCTLKTEKKKDISFSKMPFTDRVHIDEYLYGKIQGSDKIKEISESQITDFKTINTIGKGSCSRITLVEHVSSGEYYVLKGIRKDIILENYLAENIKTEKFVLNTINHPFLVNSLANFQTKERLYFLLPFIKGGDLYQLIYKKKVLDEEL